MKRLLPALFLLLFLSCQQKQTAFSDVADGDSIFTKEYNLYWESDDDAVNYLVEAAADDQFLNIAESWEVDDPPLKLGATRRFLLENGTYYFRVKPLFKYSREGEWSPPVLLHYFPLEIDFTVDSGGQIVPGDSISYHWSLNEQVPGEAVIQISDDTSFESILKEEPTEAGADEEISDIPDGDLSLRIVFRPEESSTVIESPVQQIKTVLPCLWVKESPFDTSPEWVELITLLPDGSRHFTERLNNVRYADSIELPRGEWAFLGWETTDDPYEKDIPVLYLLNSRGKKYRTFALDKYKTYSFNALSGGMNTLYLYGSTGQGREGGDAVVLSIDLVSGTEQLTQIDPVLAWNNQVESKPVSEGVERVEEYRKETVTAVMASGDELLVSGFSHFTRTDWIENSGRGVLVGDGGWIGMLASDGQLIQRNLLFGPDSFNLEQYIGEWGGLPTFLGTRFEMPDWQSSLVLAGYEENDDSPHLVDLMSPGGWQAGKASFNELTSQLVVAQGEYICTYNIDPERSVWVPQIITRLDFTHSGNRYDSDHVDLYVDSIAACGDQDVLLTGILLREDHLASWCIRLDTEQHEVLWQSTDPSSFTLTAENYPVEKVLYGEDWTAESDPSNAVDWSYTMANYALSRQNGADKISIWSSRRDVFGGSDSDDYLVPELSNWDRASTYERYNGVYLVWIGNNFVKACITNPDWMFINTFYPSQSRQDVQARMRGKDRKNDIPDEWYSFVDDFDSVEGYYTDEFQGGAIYFFYRNDTVVGIAIEVYGV